MTLLIGILIGICVGLFIPGPFNEVIRNWLRALWGKVKELLKEENKDA